MFHFFSQALQDRVGLFCALIFIYMYIHVFILILSNCDNVTEPEHDKTNKVTCVPSEDSNKPGHPFEKGLDL